MLASVLCKTVAPLVAAASEMAKPVKPQSRLSLSVSRKRLCVAGAPSTELYALITERAPPSRTAASNGGKNRSSSARRLTSMG